MMDIKIFTNVGAGDGLGVGGFFFTYYYIILSM